MGQQYHPEAIGVRQVIKYMVPFLAGLACLLSLVLVIGIFAVILQQGISAIHWNFLFSNMENAGASGGVVYQILGTLILVVSALCVAVPASLSLALLHSVYCKPSSWVRRFLHHSLQFLNAVPSVLIGLVGLLIFVQFLGWGKSWLSGGILLGVMIVPTLAVTLIQKMDSLPRRYLDASRGLGLTTQQTIASVVLPQSLSALFTGSMLGLARAAGETAPILFAAAVFSGASVPTGVKDNPVLALPYHIFVLAQDSFNPSTQLNLWGSALVLLALVMALSICALPFRLQLSRDTTT